MMGHTDKSTINARKPMTENMLLVLDDLIKSGPRRDRGQSDKSTLRALCDRGYATWAIETRCYEATAEGKSALVAAGFTKPEIAVIRALATYGNGMDFGGAGAPASERKAARALIEQGLLSGSYRNCRLTPAGDVVASTLSATEGQGK
jgi:hypothetical protein